MTTTPTSQPNAAATTSTTPAISSAAPSSVIASTPSTQATTAVPLTNSVSVAVPDTDVFDPVMGHGYWLAVFIYIVCSITVLWLWSRITRRVPKPYGGMLWIILLAVLFTPVVVDGAHPQLAPAIVGVVFAALSNDHLRLLSNIFPITLTIGVGFLFGFLYEQIKRKLD